MAILAARVKEEGLEFNYTGEGEGTFQIALNRLVYTIEHYRVTQPPLGATSRNVAMYDMYTVQVYKHQGTPTVTNRNK